MLVYIGYGCIIGVVRYICLFTLDMVVLLVQSDIYACLHWIWLYYWCSQIYMLVYIGYGCIIGVVRYICLFTLDMVVLLV